MMYEQDGVQFGYPLLPYNYVELYNNQVRLFVNSQFRAAVTHGDVEEIEQLLKNGADINTPSPNGSSVLFLAMRKDRYDIAEFLLSRGAAANDSLELEGSFAGYTPLHLACRERKWEFAKLLMCNYEVDVNIEADDGSLPIHFVVAMGRLEILRLLLDRRANLNVEFSKKLYEKLFVCKPWSNDYQNYTLLAHAIVNKNINVMELLINNGAEVATVSSKKAALFHAIEADHPTVVEFLVHKIKKKVDIKTFLDKITIRGFGAIQYAVLMGNKRIVEILLEAGADPNAVFKRVHYTKFLGYKSWTKKLSSQMSLLTHATSKNDVEMARILERFGAKEADVVSV